MDSREQVRWLFVDFNAYFASVEQQERPELRGKPVVVVPTWAESTCCIAASYEAKPFGIKTGTPVAEARALCPGLHLVEARHAVYVRYHHALVAAVDSCVPVDTVMSIDEMICRLTGRQRDVPEAEALAARIKGTIRRQVGEYVRCSIGLAPNRFLAKVAGDMKKPDGLTVIRPMDLPHILFPLKPVDLPGIARHMEARLATHGIHTIAELCAAERTVMHDIWGGVVGDRFWAWLKGEETEDIPTQRRSIGHSHVLEPVHRTTAGAWRIAKELTAKAAVRLRRLGYWAGGLAVAVQFIGRDSWQAKTRLPEIQDTPSLLKALSGLWDSLPPGRPIWVGVTFFPVIPGDRHTPSLFDNPKREQLSLVMDRINARWGRYTAYYAALQESRATAPTRIAFTQIPDLSEVDPI